MPTGCRHIGRRAHHTHLTVFPPNPQINCHAHRGTRDIRLFSRVACSQRTEKEFQQTYAQCQTNLKHTRQWRGKGSVIHCPWTYPQDIHPQPARLDLDVPSASLSNIEWLFITPILLPVMPQHSRDGRWNDIRLCPT